MRLGFCSFKKNLSLEKYNPYMRLLDKFKLISKSLTSADEDIWKPLIGGIFSPLSKTRRKRQEMYYGTVFACIDAIAQGVAPTKLRLYKTNKDGEAELQTDAKAQELLRVLKRPSRFFTGLDLLYTTSSHIDISGQSYWWIRKNGNGKPAELWPLDPARVEPVKDTKEFITGYEYTVNGNKQRFNLDEIIDIRRPNPYNYYEGLSTIQMAAYEIDNDLDGIEFNQIFFKNGATPSGVLTSEAKPTPEVQDKIKEQLQARYQGKENAFKLMVLFGGMDYKPISLSQKDMDFINQRKLSRDQILSIFRVPKPILAISDDVNRANAETGEYVFAKFTLKPRLDFIVEKLNCELLPLFGFGEEYFLSYDDVVPENRELALKEKEVSCGKWKTRNEIRAMEGLDPLPGGDDLEIDSTKMPLGDGYITQENPKKDPEEEKSLHENVKSLLSHLSPRPVSKKHPADERASGSPQDGAREKLVDDAITKATKDRLFLYRRRRYLAKQERYLASKMKIAINDLAKSVKIDKKDALSDSVEVILSKIIDTRKFQSVTAGLLFKVGLETYQAGYEQTSEGFGYGLDFQQANMNAVNYMKARSRETAESVAKSHLDESRKILERLMAEDDFTLEKAVKEIRAAIRDQSTYRSERIARTESQTAYNKGNRLAYEQSGVVEKLKWIGRDDACSICSQNIGKVADLKGGVWPSGHSEAPAHPNCRCEVIPYFE